MASNFGKQLVYKFIPYGAGGLFAWAFAESSFFPVPPDFLLIALAVISPEKALFYALICTLGSVSGAFFGYYIGIKGGRPLVKKIIKEKTIEKVEHYYKKYDVWAVGIAGLTPLPYKVFTITAGMFELDLKRFFIASVISRGGRFFMVGTLLFFYGAQVKPFLSKYFNWISLGLVVLLVLGFVAVGMIHKIKKKR